MAVIYFFGVRSALLLAGTAVLGIAGMYLGVYLLTLRIPEATLPAALALSSVAGGLGLWVSRKDLVLAKGVLIFFGAVFFSWLLRYVVQVPERPGEDAVSVLLQSVLDMQAGYPPSDARRSLAYPLLLMMSPVGTILVTITALILVSVFVVSFWVFLEESRGDSSLARWVPPIVAGLVVVTVPIVWIALAYSNSHTLMALCVTSALAVVLEAIRRGSFGTAQGFLLALSALVGSLTRLEGAVLILIILLPVLINIQRFPKRDQMLILGVSLVPGLTLGSGYLSRISPLCQLAVSS